MKNILLTLLALGIFSCQDDTQVDPQLEDNTFSVQRNGVKWSGVTKIRNDIETDTLTIWGISNEPNDEVIALRIKFDGLGQYTLLKNQAVYYTTIGGDLLMSRYILTSHSTGQLEISKYDDESKLIEGSFEMMLEKDWTYLESDTNILNFTEGSFKGKIE